MRSHHSRVVRRLNSSAYHLARRFFLLLEQCLDSTWSETCSYYEFPRYALLIDFVLTLLFLYLPNKCLLNLSIIILRQWINTPLRMNIRRHLRPLRLVNNHPLTPLHRSPRVHALFPTRHQHQLRILDALDIILMHSKLQIDICLRTLTATALLVVLADDVGDLWGNLYLHE